MLHIPMTRSFVAKSEKFESAGEESAFIMARIAADLAAVLVRVGDFAFADAASYGRTEAHVNINSRRRAILIVEICWRRIGKDKSSWLIIR